MRATFWKEFVVCLGLVALSVTFRLVAHPPNWTPVAGAALFAGFFLRRRSLAVVVPLLSMALSDLVIGTYNIGEMIAVYGCMVFPIALSFALKGRYLPVRVVGCSLISSCVFFLVTNFAVWKFGWMYSSDMSGLLRCYAAGLPFFKYTVGGDLYWSLALFGCYGLVTLMASRRAAHALEVLPGSEPCKSALAASVHCS